MLMSDSESVCMCMCVVCVMVYFEPGWGVSYIELE